MTVMLRVPGGARTEELSKDLQETLLRELVNQRVLPEEDLHEIPRRFSLFPLLSTGQEVSVHEGQRVGLRMCWLDDARLKNFQRWASRTNSANMSWEAKRQEVFVQGILTAPTVGNTWSRTVPYARLASEASNSFRTITLKFCSPTLLHRSGLPYPLPDPNEIFQQYLALWNHFSKVPLCPELPTILAGSLSLVDFRLRPRTVTEDGKSVAHFSGSATFRLKERHPETVLKGVNTLADFAFFSGTGTGTEKGRGLTRRILPDRTHTEVGTVDPTSLHEPTGTRRTIA